MPLVIVQVITRLLKSPANTEISGGIPSAASTVRG